MAPHTITLAMGAVCRCKAKSTFLVRATTPNGGVNRWASRAAHDPKCPSARRLRMVRKDTEAPSEGATYAWMAADEEVGCKRAFPTM
ncbi:hypothetical protein TNCV_1464881 [Trichonephila clavipes]|nr:hypothetical protein TNCV_1464881 [Trichonephila clavipes]